MRYPESRPLATPGWTTAIGPPSDRARPWCIPPYLAKMRPYGHLFAPRHDNARPEPGSRASFPTRAPRGNARIPGVRPPGGGGWRLGALHTPASGRRRRQGATRIQGRNGKPCQPPSRFCPAIDGLGRTGGSSAWRIADLSPRRPPTWRPGRQPAAASASPSAWKSTSSTRVAGGRAGPGTRAAVVSDLPGPLTWDPRSGAGSLRPRDDVAGAFISPRVAWGGLVRAPSTPPLPA